MSLLCTGYWRLPSKLTLSFFWPWMSEHQEKQKLPMNLLIFKDRGGRIWWNHFLPTRYISRSMVVGHLRLLSCKWITDFHSKWQPRTILSKNNCHFLNLLSFGSSSFFLSMRKIKWLNLQQPKTIQLSKVAWGGEIERVYY